MTVAAACDWFRQNEGRVESPPNSNHVPFVWGVVDDIYGADYDGQPWCGGAVLVACNDGGWKPPVNWVSVAQIEAWGKANNRWHSGAGGMKAGDTLVLFGHGVHTEMALSSASSGRYTSGGGNTSQGGQSSNGGMVCVQSRPTSDVRGYVRTCDLLDQDQVDPTRLERDTMYLLKPKAGQGQHYVIQDGNAAPLKGGYTLAGAEPVIIVLAKSDDGAAFIKAATK
jgi:hypothetical protein